MTESGDRTGGRTSLLTGATLFLVLAVYFNVRSPGPTGTVDWIVMGGGAVFFIYAVARRMSGGH